MRQPAMIIVSGTSDTRHIVRVSSGGWTHATVLRRALSGEAHETMGVRTPVDDVVAIRERATPEPVALVMGRRECAMRALALREQHLGGVGVFGGQAGRYRVR